MIWTEEATSGSVTHVGAELSECDIHDFLSARFLESQGQGVGDVPRILVVDDEPAIQRLFVRILSEDGYHVTPAGSARQALMVIQERVFEVAIVDLSLPDADGLDLIRQIHSESPWLRVLAISGFMGRTVANLAIAAGAMATLSKPTTPGELRNAVYQLLDPSLSWRGTQSGIDGEGGTAG